MSVNFVTLNCPYCNGKLQATDDPERYTCLFCGAEHIIQRSSMGASAASQGTARTSDKVASASTIRRLREDLTQLEGRLAALNLNATSQSLPPTRKASLLLFWGQIIFGLLTIFSLCSASVFLLPSDSKSSIDNPKSPDYISPEKRNGYVTFCGVPGLVFLGLTVATNRRRASFRRQNQDQILSAQRTAVQYETDKASLIEEITRKRAELMRHEQTVSS
jgi:hypothetical protein